MSRQVVVLGAGSQVGVFALPMLAARGWEVIAVSRGGAPGWYPPLPGVDWVREPDAARTRVARNAGILSLGPIGLAVQWLQADVAPACVVALSSSSVISKRESGSRREREQVGALLAAEAELQQSCARLGAPLCLLRPTLVYGSGMDRNLSLLARCVERFGVVPVGGRAEGLRQPVHAEDLALAVVRALEGGVDLLSPLCGGSTLSYRDMVAGLFTALGRRPRILSLPARVLAAAVWTLSRLPALHGVNPEMVWRQSRDLVFDDSAARITLAVTPRAFAPVAADFRLPASRRLVELAVPRG